MTDEEIIAEANHWFNADLAGWTNVLDFVKAIQPQLAAPVAAQGEPCSLCDGAGTLDGTAATCPNCDRTGKEPAQGERQPCFHTSTIMQYTGDGTPVEFCRDCGTNRRA
jgi:hypothetical protein